MSTVEVETRTFRAGSLDDVLGTVRDELGPGAIVVRQREGVVGGIGGFFGKRCVEVDVECPPEPAATGRRSAMPARAVTDAYAAAPEVEPFELDELWEDDGGDLFQSLIGDSSLFASTLAGALEEPAPGSPPPLADPVAMPVAPLQADVPAGAGLVRAPVTLPAIMTPATMMLSLEQAGLDLKLAQGVISEADSQLRPFDPGEPFENHVRQVLAGRIATRRLHGRSRHRVIALVGAPGSGKTSAAARLCEAHAAAGRHVVAVSLEPVRKTLELARQTAATGVELISADDRELVGIAHKRVAAAEVVIVDTFGIEPGDAAAWRTLGGLLGPLGVHETHILVRGSLDAAGIESQLGAAAAESVRIDRFVLTHLDDGASPGPAVSVSLRAGIPISATTTATRLVPADPHSLAALIVQ